MANDIEIRVGSEDNTGPDFDALKAHIDELKRARADITIDAEDKSAVAKLAAVDAKIAALDAKAAKPNITVTGAARAEADIAAVDLSMDRLSKSGDSAGQSAAGLGESLGGLATPMAGMIGAGAALAPVLVTLGIGTAGFGAAAMGTVMPIEKAASATGGLQKNMSKLDPEQQALAQSILKLGKQYDAFQKALQPQVLGVFGKGLQLASHLMGDVEPVAKATGQAIGGLLNRIDQEFQSGTWQNFFGFMAKTAGPDIQLLGNNLIDLMNTLPPLLQDLQGTAQVTLTLTDDVLKLAGGFFKARDAAVSWQQHQEESTKSTNVASQAWHWFAGLIGGMDKNLTDAGKTLIGMSTATDKAGSSSAGAAVKVSQLAQDEHQAAQAALQLNADWNILAGNFASKDQVLVSTAQSFLTLKDSIKKTGDNSLASRGDFDSYIQAIGSGVTALRTAGASTDQVNKYLQTQINRLQSLGPLNKTEQAELQGLKKYQDELANSTANMTAKQLGTARAMENSVIPDLRTLHAQTPLVTKDVSNLTDSIINSGNKSASTRADRQHLITDLENIGVKASDARALADKLTGSIHGIPSHVSTSFTDTGTGKITIQDIASTSGGSGLPGYPGNAAGGLIDGPGTATSDSIVRRLSKGEYVVRAAAVDSLGIPFLNAINSAPGLASGGPVDGLGTWEQRTTSRFGSLALKDYEAALSSAYNKALAKDRAAAAAVGAGAPGPGGGAPSANAALARRLYPEWGSGANWEMWNYIAERESGWNNTITNGGRPYNPYTVAYGIPQALPAIKMGAAANPPESNPTAQIHWMHDYIEGSHSYGSGLAAAYNNEVNASWYDQGGMLMPGTTLATNNTGKPEMILPAGLTASLVSTSGPMAKLATAVSDPTGPMVKLKTTVVDPGGPMVGLTKAVTGSTGPYSSLAKALDRADGPMDRLATALNDFNPGTGGGGGSGGSGGGGSTGKPKRKSKPGLAGSFGWGHGSGLFGGHGGHHGGGSTGAHPGPVRKAVTHPGPHPGPVKPAPVPFHGIGGRHGFASGGISSGGWAEVGEYGRELVRLPSGSTVTPNGQAETALAGGGFSPAKIQLEWVGSNAGDELMVWLRKNIRIRGGDVQAVLGR